MKKRTNNSFKKAKNKAFTLIELLAVIVILALIALIAIPIILNILEKVRKNAFKDTAYGIMESAKVKYAEAMLDGTLEPSFFEYPFDNLEFNGTKPKGGMVTIDKNGLIALALYNDHWCAIKNKEDNEVRVIAYDVDTCNIEAPMIIEGSSVEALKVGLDSAIPGSYFNIKNVNGSVTCFNLSDGEREIHNTNELGEGENEIECRMIDHGSIVTSLKRTFNIISNRMTGLELVESNSEIASLDPDKNARFVGSDPNNYVKFGNDLYRIIGVFDNQMKIIYWGTLENPGIFYDNRTIKFDPDASQNGHGIMGYSDWNQSPLNEMLNSTYWNSIPVTYQAMVDQHHIWNIGGTLNYDDRTRSQFYTAERSSTISSIMTSDKWEGKIGLMYPSDYGYATSSDDLNCDSTIMYSWNSGNAKTYCAGTEYNWLANTSFDQWTMTPCTFEVHYVFTAYANGYLNGKAANADNVVRPVLYLNSSVKVSGEGTLDNPFELTID